MQLQTAQLFVHHNVTPTTPPCTGFVEDDVMPGVIGHHLVIIWSSLFGQSDDAAKDVGKKITKYLPVYFSDLSRTTKFVTKQLKFYILVV